MTILKILSGNPRSLVPKPFIAAVLALASIGFLAAFYLAVKRLTGGIINCYFFSGCDTVAASPYSAFLGVPLSLIGAVFYLLVILSAVAYLLYSHPNAFRALVILSTLGFLLSAYFTFLQAFVIKAFCLYCVISAIVATLNFIITVFAWRKYFYTPPDIKMAA